MRKEHRGRIPMIEIKKKIYDLVESGLSFEDIAKSNIKGLETIRTRQLVRYHYLSYPQFAIDKEK